MNRDTWFHLAVAVLTVAALGTSATTLNSTMETDADEVIDLEYDQIPLGEERAAAVADRIQRSKPAENGESSQQRRSEGDSDASSDSTDAGPSEALASVSAHPVADADSTAEQRSRSAADRRRQRSESEREGGTRPSPRDRPLAQLLHALPTLAVIAAFLAGAALVVRYRDRLHALGRQSEKGQSGGNETTDDDRPGRPPANAVDRAWASMVERLDVRRPATRTPNECAAAAIAAGLDRDAVEALTEAFVEVRYGKRPVTERRERIARRSRRQFEHGGSA